MTAASQAFPLGGRWLAEGQTDEGNGLRRGTFLRRKVPKSRHGATGAEGPSRAKRARFPLVPPFGVRPAAAKFNDPPNLRAVTMPVRLVRIVTAWPEQSYPPRLVSCCNSRGVLNAARGLCAVFQSPVEATQAFPPGGRCPSAHTGADEGKEYSKHRSPPHQSRFRVTASP